MSKTGQNFIAGSWCDGQRTIANINPSDLSDQIGPVVSAGQLAKNPQWMKIAKEKGGEALSGGETVSRDHDGYYMTPAVISGTKNGWRINREEMFAPIARIIKVGSYEEALDVVSDTEFGLTSGIITRSLSRATHFRRNAQTGVVTINLPTAGTDYHVPFGGRGNSSYGPREQESYAAELYTIVKTSYIDAGNPE